jgi:hypothetical protein
VRERGHKILKKKVDCRVSFLLVTWNGFSKEIRESMSARLERREVCLPLSLSLSPKRERRFDGRCEVRLRRCKLRLYA